MNIFPNWWTLHNVRVWHQLHKQPERVIDWVKESVPYWEALRHDDHEAWLALPSRDRLWLVTSEGALVEDTKWTAAAKTGARECLLAWTPDKELAQGQQVWGTAENGFGHPKFGGGSVLHSIAPLTFDPKIAYLIKDWIEQGHVPPLRSSWEGVTPLHVFGAYGHAAGIELLMQHKADPTALTRTGACPLEYAAQYGTVETVKKLLHWGAWNVGPQEQERVLKAAIEGRAGKDMEAVFLRSRLFPSVEDWVSLRERVKKFPKDKDVVWAKGLWEQEDRPIQLNREQRRAKGDFESKKEIK
jgi:hypothetical protein